MTQTTAPAFRYIGITDECVECQCCGKTGLRSTVILAVLDADQNAEDVTYYGSTCAARALAVKGGGRAVLQSARWAHEKTLTAAESARQALAFYGLPEVGTPSLRELREPLWKYVDAHSNAMWMEGSTADENRARLVESLGRWQAQLAEAALLTRAAA